MRLAARLLAALAVAIVGVPAAGWSAPAAAQEPGGIAPPEEWAGWDLNGDDQLTIDEYQQLSEADSDALQNWIDQTLDAVDDNDFRDWASEHFDFATEILLDIPSRGALDQVRDAPGDISEGVTGAALDLADGVADSAFDAVAQRMGEAAADLTGYIGEEMARTGTPQLEADWYRVHYQRMLGWAGLLILPLAMFGIGSAAARGDSAKVGHTLLQVPMAYLMGLLALSAVAAASGLSAAMSRSLVPGMQDASREIGPRVAELWMRGLAPGLILLLGLVIALGALVTLLWLLLAEAAIYAVVLFIPLAFAGRVWEPARDWGRKLLTTAFSLVAAKVVIFAVWALAVDGLAEASAGDVPLRSALALAALLVMTALAPAAAMRLVPMLEGTDRAGSPGAGARSALSTAYYVGGVSRTVSSRGGGGSGRGGGGAALPVTGQIGGAAARAPASAGRSGGASSGVPAGRSGGDRGRPGSGPESAPDGRRGSSPAGSGGRPGSSGPSPSRPASGSSRPASSGTEQRAAPPTLPPGTGSGKPWQRPEQ